MIEKQVLIRRLQGQKSLQTFDDRDLKKLAKEVERANKELPKPDFAEVYQLLEEVADKLYLFLSRDQIQRLPKLGILGQQLAQLVAKDIRNLC